MTAAFDPMNPPPWSEMTHDWEWNRAELGFDLARNPEPEFDIFDAQEAAQKGGPMPYKVSAERLADFVRAKTEELNRRPTPDGIEPVGDLPSEQVRALWLAAGVAEIIGVSIAADPSRFVDEVALGSPVDGERLALRPIEEVS
jgi:hypothetical protein